MNYPIYPVRDIGVYPNYYVQQEDENSCFVFITPQMGEKSTGIRIYKKDMRLLSKRILQCLSEWGEI